MTYTPDTITKELIAELSKRPNLYGHEVISALSSFPVFSGTCEFMLAPSGSSWPNVRELIDRFAGVYMVAVQNALGSLNPKRAVTPVAVVVVERTRLRSLSSPLTDSLAIKFRFIWAIPAATVYPLLKGLKTHSFLTGVDAIFPGAKFTMHGTGYNSEKIATTQAITLAAKRSQHLPANQSPITTFSSEVLDSHRPQRDEHCWILNDNQRRRFLASRIVRQAVSRRA